MKLYFVNCLLALSVVSVTFRTATAGRISIFDVISDKDNGLAETLRDSSVEPANSIDSSEPVQFDPPKKNAQRKSKLRKYIKVDLDQPEGSITLEEGQSFELTCITQSHPRAQVYWVRGYNLKGEIEKLLRKSEAAAFPQFIDDQLTRIHSKYIVDCASKKDEGPIHCVGIAGDNVGVKTSVINVVESNNGLRACGTERKPVITKWIKAIFSQIGSTIWLPCEAEGVPRPKTKWISVNDTTIDNNYNPRYKIFPNGALMIENLQWSDMGCLICMAESSSGSNFVEGFIYPVKPEERRD